MATFETRVWHADNKPYQSYVPDLMHDKPHFTSINLHAMVSTLNQYAIPQVHTRFFTRYLAGNVSLREGTQVSHKQLALCSIAIPSDKPVIQQLWSQIYNFQRGCHFAATQLSNPDCTAESFLYPLHKILAPEVTNRGRFRKSACWIGGKTPTEARFVAADVSHFKTLMADWLMALKSQSPMSIEKTLMLYDQFLVIHPFSDGNGRVSRVFMEAALSQLRNEYWLHPLFYRLANSSKQYIDAHNAFERDELEPWLLYWESAFEWLFKKQQQIHFALAQCEQQFQNALACSLKPIGWDKLMQQLFSTPIIRLETAHQHLDAATMMLQSGLLVVKHVHAMNNMPVLECPLVFKLWQRWEDILLASEPA